MFSTRSVLSAAGLLSVAAGIMAASPDLEQALGRIRNKVEVFENQVPDFVCREKITSRTIAEKDSRVEKETVVESTFSGRQSHSALSKLGGLSFKEERHIETVDGVPSKEKSMPQGVFRVGGGYSSLLVTIFGSKGAANYAFSPAGADPDSPEGSFGVAFATKNGKQKIRGKDGARTFQATGLAWFDPVSCEVIRLEQRILPQGDDTSGGLSISVEYRPVRIGESEFRLPVRVRATAHRVDSGKAERGEYTAEYSNYRKYGSSTTIQYRNSDK
jgi:hypothetical protein